MSDSPRLTSPGVSRALCSLPLLRSVALARCKLLGDGVLEALGASCLMLSSAKLDELAVTDSGVAAMAAGCGGLEVLSLRGCRRVGDRAVLALCEHVDALLEIDLVSTACSRVAAASLAGAFLHSIRDIYTSERVVTGGSKEILRLVAAGR